MGKEPVVISQAPWETKTEPAAISQAPWETDSETEQTVIGSIARGAGAGVVDIAQGITELGAAGLAAADVDVDQQGITNFFEDTKKSLGLTPERTAGKVVETIVNYGAPGIGVFNWVSKAKKAADAARAGTLLPAAKTWFGKSAETFGRTGVGKAATKTRTGRAALTTAGTGVADFFVAPSTNTSLADSWDAMPENLRTEDEEGLTGKALAAVRLRNKFKLGLEGAMFNAAGEVILPVVGGTVRTAAQIPGVPLLARGISTGLDFLGSKIGSVPIVKKLLTPNGFTPPEIATAVRTAEGMTEAEEAAAAKLLSNYDTAIKKAIRAQRLTGRGRTALQRAYNDTMDYMTGEIGADAFGRSYGAKARESVDAMRNQIDTLSTEFEQSVRAAPNLNASQQDELLQQFQSNQGTYIRRLYELHLNPEKFRTVDPASLPQYQQAKDQIRSVIQSRNSELTTEMADQQAEQFISKIFNDTTLNSGLTAEARARQVAAGIAQGAKETVGRKSLFGLAEGMLKSRSEFLDQAPVLREMMGEIRNPREAFLRTIDNMSTTKASQRLFDSISSTGVRSFDEAVQNMNAGGRPFVVAGDTLTDPQIKTLEGLNYVKMGEFNPDNPFGGKYGSLSGNYVPTEIYNSLTTPGRAQSGVQDALAVALQLKGLSQMTKTVLNPLSQVRNFLSNTFVVGANGLLGRNMGIFESGQVLVANAIDSPEQFKLLKAMQDEGAIGQNIQINELRRLMEEQTEQGVSSMLGKAGRVVREKVPVVGPTVKFMEKTYQLGDDYWKVVGALGEKARYGSALRKAGLDIENVDPAVQDALLGAGLAQRTSSIANTDFGDMLAVDLVKSTMPTYSMVPEAIKQLRRIPVVGNFMAFPAEIIRTSGNIVNRAVKEMGFKPTQAMIDTMGEQQARAFARQIRGIGAERLSGYVSMATVAPIAMREASHDILGITEQEEKVLEKNAPFWTLGNKLMFLTKPDKNGEAEYVDLSYMLPYEFMLTPARAALQTYAEKGEIGANESEQLLAASWEAFKKFAEPFASEALAAERVYDVTLRQGKTATGAEIYEEGEMWGDKLGKSLTHVVGAFIPGIVDQAVTIKGGEFVPGRATRAITGDPSKQGDPYTIAEEAGTMLTGLRPMKLNIGRSLGYAGGEYSSLRSSAVQIFTKVADDNDATAEDVVNAYVQANEARRRQQAQLKSTIDAALDSGMSRAQVTQAFKNSGVSKKELNAILANRYVPIKVSRNLIREVNNEVNVKKENRILQRLPLTDINTIRFSLLNTPIIGEPSAVVVEKAPWETQGSISAQPPVVIEPTEPAPSILDTAASAVSSATESVANLGGNLIDRARTLAPSILGGDPAAQSANEEILRRQQSGQ